MRAATSAKSGDFPRATPRGRARRENGGSVSRRTPERKRRWRTKRRRRWKWKEPEEDFELVLPQTSSVPACIEISRQVQRRSTIMEAAEAEASIRDSWTEPPAAKKERKSLGRNRTWRNRRCLMIADSNSFVDVHQRDSTHIENIKIQYCIATNTLTMPRISTYPDAPNKSGFLQPARSKRTNDLPWLTRFPVTTSPADSAPDNKTGSGDTKNTHVKLPQIATTCLSIKENDKFDQICKNVAARRLQEDKLEIRAAALIEILDRVRLSVLLGIRTGGDERSSSVDTTLCGGLKYPNQFYRMTREKLCVISPGGISLLRLIQGLLVRMPIPHLAAFPGYGRNREGRGKRRKIDRDTESEREREERAGESGRVEQREERRIQYEATPQRIKHPSVLVFLVSYTEEIVKIRSYRRHPQLHTLAGELRDGSGGSLMAKFSIRQTSVRGNGSSFSHREEPNMPGS
ncbi:hypothetical protein WN51_14015 [Melipona quadrifasciata]|uniref:Uncharacterized protein n=1 Tax=Melipona quadrifasciata TaxID=166423 RepID=A0A0M8ZZ86_9HYME|nr:hypothetical protein WN51_14015 [Melipona quadrifasciata]